MSKPFKAKSIDKMSVDELLKEYDITFTVMYPVKYSKKKLRAELIRRFSDKDERIKVLEGIVKNYQETCEKMINR